MPSPCIGDTAAALQWIAARYQLRNVTLTQAAEDLGVSRSRLGKLLIRETGFTFGEQLKKQRIAKATELLLADKNKGLKALAWSVGYGHLGNFVRDFRRLHGLTPSVFRRRNTPG